MATAQTNGTGGDGLTVTMVGAGGMSFGPAMVNDVVHTAGEQAPARGGVPAIGGRPPSRVELPSVDGLFG